MHSITTFSAALAMLMERARRAAPALRTLVLAIVGTVVMTGTAAGSSVPTGSMATPRSHHVAVALPEADGTVQRILVTGGQSTAGAGAPLSSTEIYTVATGTWSAGPNLPTARTDLFAVAIPRGVGAYSQGGVFVGGGTNAAGAFVTAPEIYNVATNSWTNITAIAVAGRRNMTVSIAGSRVVMAGGANSQNQVLATVQIFDVATGFAVGGAFDMLSPRYLHTATVLPNGRLLVTGGYAGITVNAQAVATGETLDPQNPGLGWTATGTMTAPRANHTAAVADSTRALISGGVPDINAAAVATSELYNQATNTFTSAGSMNAARRDHIGLAMRPGWVAQVGGTNVANPNGIDDVDSWSPTFGWAGLYGLGGPEAAGAGARTFNTATAIPQTEEILIAGGNTPPVATAVRYQANQPTPTPVPTPTPTPVPTPTPPPSAVPTPTPAAGPVPVQNQSVAVAPVSGKVYVRIGTSNEFRELREGDAIPVGTVLDTADGRVRLTSIFNGVRQTAEFYGGTFKVLQPKGQGGMVELRLIGKPTCSVKKAKAAVKRKAKPRVWGDGKGRFRTRGSNSSATVRGTKWLVEERCNGTYTKVARGIVSVRDFTKHRTVLVKAKRTYLAKPPKKK
jgi:biotin carboxyl carrier protein